jgi:hypothetical protein
LKDSLAGYSILGWQLVSLKAWVTLLHAFLAFRVYVERYEMILMCSLLYVNYCFSPSALGYFCSSLALPF